MCALVRQNHVLRAGLQPEGQINSWPNHAEDERGRDEFRLEHVSLQPHRRAHAKPQAQRGNGRVQDKHRAAAEPDPRGKPRQNLQRVRALRGVGRECSL